MATSIYAQVTDVILKQLETADPISWSCPWHRTGGGLPINALTHRAYRGINILSLWCAARGNGFGDDRWATYRQWADLGAQVRRGEKGSMIVFYKDITERNAGAHREHDREEDEISAPARFIAKASIVFNASQVDNWQQSAPEPVPPSPQGPTPVFDAFVAATQAAIEFGGDRASYAPAADLIRMPARERFRSADGYTATLAHELIHWTGAKHRLDRDLTTRFGSKAYDAEELVAELGAAFILVGLKLAATPHPDHAAYMAGWLPLLRQDPRALFIAAARASSATDYLQTCASAAAAPRS